MPKIVPFEISHLRDISFRDEENWLSAISLEDIASVNNELAWSLEVDGKIVACAGVLMLWEGVAELWTIIDKDIDIGLTLVRCIKRVLYATIEGLSLHRVQASVNINDHRARKLVRVLGMKLEGRKEKYNSSKDDFFEYVIIEE